jgi:hypothetical protein
MATTGIAHLATRSGFHNTHSGRSVNLVQIVGLKKTGEEKPEDKAEEKEETEGASKPVSTKT